MVYRVKEIATRWRLLLFALVAVAGLGGAIIAQFKAIPNLGVWENVQVSELERKAEDFLNRHTGRAAPLNTVSLLQVTYQDTGLTRTLLKSFSDQEVTRRMRENRWPLAMKHFAWVRKDGSLGACIGVTPWGDIAWYLDAEALSETRNADPSPSRNALLIKAEQFLTEVGLDAANFGVAQVEDVPGVQNATEIRWRRTAFAEEKLVQIVCIRFQGDAVWFFQNQVTALSDSTRLPITMGQILPLLAGGPNVLLLCVAAWHLWRASRRQELLWGVGVWIGIGLAGVALLDSLNMFPFGFGKAIFRNDILATTPQSLKFLTSSAPFPTFMALLGLIPVVSYGLWTGVAALIAMTSVLQLETDARRNISELLRNALAIRHAPLQKLLEALVIGSATGFVLLGVGGVLRAIERPGSVYADVTGIQLVLDGWSQDFHVASAGARFVIQNGLIYATLAWMLLTVRFGISKKVAAVVLSVFGSVEFESGFQTLFFPNAAFSWSAFFGNALAFLAFAFILEKYGVWTALLAFWSYQFGEVTIAAVALPSLGVSPMVMIGVGLAPLASLALALRKPSVQSAAGALTPTLLDRYVEEQRYERQLATAARIQTEFLPKATPSLVGWDIAARSLPAREVGGDFYDFISLNDGKLGLLVGDISGKSVPGALFMVVATTAFRSEAEESDSECAPLLERLNQLLYPDMKRVRMFAAAGYAVLEPATGALTLANAGLPQPLLYCAAEKRSEYLDLNGLPLGSMRMSAYAEGNIALQPNDILILSSDGIVEALNENEEAFGYDALQRLIQEHSSLSASDLAERIFLAVQDFTGDVEQSDDITALIVKREPPPTP